MKVSTNYNFYSKYLPTVYTPIHTQTTIVNTLYMQDIKVKLLQTDNIHQLSLY